MELCCDTTDVLVAAPRREVLEASDVLCLSARARQSNSVNVRAGGGEVVVDASAENAFRTLVGAYANEGETEVCSTVLSDGCLLYTSDAADE